MDIFQITDRDSVWFDKMWEVYSYSFPEHEKRKLENQLEALKNNKCRIDAYTEDDIFIGFVIYWIYPTYIYIEHFALSEQVRQGGKGTAIITELIERYKELPIILDIDPVVDSISERRRNFYFRLGFLQSAHQHLCPPYKEGELPFELLLLTTKQELTESEYKGIKESLYNEMITY